MKRRTLLSTTLAAAPAALLGQSATDSGKIKYLQIGTGHAHANKIQQYADSDQWEVVGIVEENEELRQKAKNDKVFGKFPLLSMEAGMNTPGLKVVGIETEIRDLLKNAEMAIDAGYHVHLDKPAGADLDHYERILKKADQQNLVVQMGYMYRFSPAVQLLHRILDAGWLGEIFETHAVMSKVLPQNSREYLDEFEGGIMFELGCHIVDLTLGVLGAPDKVVAYPKRVIDSPDDTLIDNMLAVFEYPKATATVRSSGVEVEGFARRQFTVCGTGGTIHIQPLDRPKMKISLAREHSFEGESKVYKKGHTEIDFGPYTRYAGDIEDLAKIVKGQKENPYPSSHDLAIQKAVLAASGL
ncbi:MAG: Gfo/Idh/MocA family oxidoreductase [Verrucomicrobiales bacterium]|nr:Gfo/Idh/MocA family oxidoreductase [Verrucomicrobiales bacterium]